MTDIESTIGEHPGVTFVGRRTKWEPSLEAGSCLICGGRVRKGEGIELEPDKRLHRNGFWPDGRPMPPRAGDNPEEWRRVHPACAELRLVDIVRLVADRADLSDPEALEVAERGGVPLSAREADPRKPGSRPWSWITKEDRAHLDKAVATVTQRLRAGGLVCASGPCGWCGRERSTTWTIGPSAWRAGRSEAPPLCEECADKWDLAGQPQSKAACREIALSLLTGMPRVYGQDAAGLRVHADLEDHHDCKGHPEPWSYSQGIQAVREVAWRRNPWKIPNERDRTATWLALESEHIEELAAINEERKATAPAEIEW